MSLVVAAGGAVGSVLRYWLVVIFGKWLGESLPYGVLFVNVSGSLVMGLLVGGFLGVPTSHHLLRGLLAVGVLGGFTTFSSFSLDAVKLIDRGEIAWLLIYVALSVIGGIGGLIIGRCFVRWIV